MRQSAVKRTPRVAIGCANGSQNRYAGVERGGEAADKTPAEALGATEAVDHEEVHPVCDRARDDRLGIEQAALVEPAAAGASATRFPDVEGLAGTKIHDMDRCGALTPIAGGSLDDAAQVKSTGAQRFARPQQQLVHVEPVLVADRR
jgi:hypothetical protein